MNKDDFHIVYATDENYLDYVAVALGSALIWSSDVRRTVIDVLTLDIADGVWTKWYNSVIENLPVGSRIVRHVIDPSLFSDFKQWHGSRAAYARLLLPEMMPDVTWCAYADVDTLFTDDPLKLEELLDSNVAIFGHLENTLKPLESERGWFESRGLPFDKNKYFCSGFVLINLAMFREKKYGAKCFDFLQRYPDVLLPDQDALNAVCFEKERALPYEWGAFGCEAFAQGRPGAIHYPGHNPWCFTSVMFPDYLDAWNIWFRYAKYLFGKSWRDYVREQTGIAKYLRMRLLGFVFSRMRYVMTALNFFSIPFVGRYVKRHYASKSVWREMNACLVGKGGRR